MTKSFPKFGKIDKSISKKLPPDFNHYRSGQFFNQLFTPLKPKEVSYFEFIKNLSKKKNRVRPDFKLPFYEPNFQSVEKLKITWFGHSSYMLQLEHKNILVDPIFSERASPFSWLGSKRFEGTDFSTDQLPEIDILIITHDHYDHLDYYTLKNIHKKVKQIICPIGVASHLQYWGIDASKIQEMCWGEEIKLFENWTIFCRSSRHFSGRFIYRNVSLWASFVLKTSQMQIYMGGDSGYGTHFKEIGEEFGSFDLSILECGQYNYMWPNIHLFPKEVLQASNDLNAKHLLPVHWGKFSLSLHPWNQSILDLEEAWKEGDSRLLKPYLGQSFDLGTDFSKPHWARFMINI